ncbi:MAG TPA: DUF2087 domain-containing protein [Kineosporiaceae bacterium]|nr:DUF2087 domain-containing protein [Kineosporiaceae bacterium]
MDANELVRLLADPQRRRVFAAVALGATTPETVATAAGIDPRAATAGLGRLQATGLLADGPDGWHVAEDRLRELAKASQGQADADRTGFEPFVEDGRLRTLPSKQARRRAVLAHVVETSFDADAVYDERAVNEVLERWCEGGNVDHVTIRRYLVDAQLLFRVGGVYARRRETLPAPGEAEHYLDAIGLN